MADNLNISGLRVGVTGESYSKKAESSGSFSSDSYPSPNSGAYEYNPRERKGTSTRIDRLAGKEESEESEIESESQYLRRKAFNKFMFYLVMFALVGTVVYQAYYEITAPKKATPPPREVGPQKVVPLWYN
jgi:hypothetical protein